MPKTERVKFLDCTRALCMLYIIGMWHMQEYLVENISITSLFTSSVTNGVLASFTFISAYFLGKRPVNSRRDALAFYKKRVLRLYPLFFISCTSLLLIHYLFHIDYISGIKQYALTLLGLSTVFTPAPQTVWFVSMMILLYLITPLINFLKQTSRKILWSVVIFAVLCALRFFGFVDNRLLLYFPVYFAGLLLSNRLTLSDRLNWKPLVIGAAVFAAGFAAKAFFNLFVFSYIIVAGFIAVSFELGKLCAKGKIVFQCLSFISYASMTAYLFHRQFFGVVVKLVGKFPIWAAYLVFLPLLLVISYGVQYVYDRLLSKLSRKN